MKIDTLALQAKGWSQEEIEHARSVLLKAEQNKHPRILRIEKLVYWFLFGIVLIGSVIGIWLTLPFLSFIQPLGAIAIIFIAGLLFGSIASILVKDVEQIEVHHHLAISILIPISALISSLVISKQASIITEVIRVETTHNPLLLAIMYSVGSLLPFGILLWVQRKEDGTF